MNSDGLDPLGDARDQQIAVLQRELAAAQAELLALVATVSHDLRAPLRHITSYARLVQEDAGPQLTEEVQGFLSTITDSALRMGAQLDGLLALSRVGSAALRLQSVSLAELIASICTDLQVRHADRRIAWQIMLPVDLPAVVADAALLRQALCEVLGNAVKFTAMRADAVIQVSAGALVHGDTVRLCVQDNGAGYNPALQAQLFTVFGRLHSASQFAGIGMGLVLARKCLQRMQGSVDSCSAAGGGCTVTVLLPAAPASDGDRDQ